MPGTDPSVRRRSAFGLVLATVVSLIVTLLAIVGMVPQAAAEPSTSDPTEASTLCETGSVDGLTASNGYMGGCDPFHNINWAETAAWGLAGAGLGGLASKALRYLDDATRLRDDAARLGQQISDKAKAANAGGGAGRTFTHFTDEAGAKGIAGSAPSAVGESTAVGQLQFAKGQNPYLIGEGRIGVTDLGLDATPGQLNGIGVFGPKQQYAIQFTELDAFNSGVRVSGDLPSRNIFSIPGGCTITGACSVTRVR